MSLNTNNQMCQPSPTRPLMIIRVASSGLEPEVWDKLFPVLRDNRVACDEVWFSTSIGLPELAEHQRRAAILAKCAEQLRSVGIKPSVEIQATIGHGDGFLDQSDIPARNWGGFTGADGTVCKFSSCPRQPGFLAYFHEVAKIYAAWHPASIWIDDDCRLGNHWPVMERGGCYCDTCIAAFSKEVGHHWTRETLVEACKTTPTLWQRWREFGASSLAQLAKTIAEGVHEVSPQTILGHQHDNDALAVNAVLKALQEGSSMRSASRPGGGAYSDRDPFAFFNKAFNFSDQINDQAGYDTVQQICAEIENCPRVFTCKTAQGLRIESLLYLALGCDSLSYFVMYPHREKIEWYRREVFEPLAAGAPCYKDFAKYNVGTMPGGLAFKSDWWWPDRDGLPLIGIPAAAKSKLACATIIDKEIAEQLSDAQLRKVLAGDIILDGEATAILQKRGLSDLIGGFGATLLQGSAVEKFTDDQLNQDIVGITHTTLDGVRHRIDIPEGVSVRIAGKYYRNNGNEAGAASILMERPDGTRIAILGYGGFDTRYICSARVQFLSRVADWVAHGKLPVLCEEPTQLALIPRIEPNGTLRSVTILNPVIGEQHPCTLRLRQLPNAVTSTQWCVPGKTPVSLTITRDGADALVTLPTIAAWEIGWLKL